MIDADERRRLGNYPQTAFWQFVEKLLYVVILSEAKDLLVIQISDLQILRRPWLLRMTAFGDFFNKLLGEEILKVSSTARVCAKGT